MRLLYFVLGVKPRPVLRMSVVMHGIAALLFFTHAAFAQTFFVKEGATGSGASWDDAQGTIPTGIMQAGTKIYVAAGSYTVAQESSLSREGYLIQGGFSIESTGTNLDSYNPVVNRTAITKTPGNYVLFRLASGSGVPGAVIEIKGVEVFGIQNTGNLGSILYSSAAVNDFNITDVIAHDIQGNGAFYMTMTLGGTTTFKNCNFYSNYFYNSWGLIFMNGGGGSTSKIRIINSVINRNQTGNQAVVALNNFPIDDAVSIENSLFCNNTAPRGALSLISTSAAIQGSIFTGNSAVNQGVTGITGAVYILSSRRTRIQNSGFYGNTGGTSGAIQILGSFASQNTITNTIFLGNRTNTSNGGAISLQESNSLNSWTITNSKFIDNTAFGNGGAIFKDYSKVILDQTTFAGNFAAAGNDIMATANGESFYVSNSKLQLPSAESYTNTSSASANYAFGDNNIFSNTDTDGVIDPGYSCPKSISFPITVSGNVFNDANGLTDGIVNGTSDNLPYLTVSLVQGENLISRQTVVNGAYSFSNVAQGQYNLILNISAPDRQLDADWVTTGENIGTQAGHDGEPDGILAITAGSSSIAHANFGINKLPVASPMSPEISPVNSNTFVTLDGVEGNPAAPAGEDMEDGALGDGTMMVITSLPTHGELYYGDTLVVLNRPFQLNLNTFRLKLTGSGYTSLSFNYAFIDAAGSQGPASTYTLNFTAPLPVILAQFSAEKEGSTALLSWTTTSETRSDRFEILHSLEGKSWQRIGEVKAAGESHTAGHYSFIHQNPSAGENLYRLRMVDTDGSAALSRIASLNFDSVADVNIYPNPVADVLTLQFSDWTSVSDIRILSAKGTEVYRSGKIPAQQIDVKTLHAGMYVVKATRKDGSFVTRKIVINR